jgi:exosortase E/protease (VPEID-CTERM system)
VLGAAVFFAGFALLKKHTVSAPSLGRFIRPGWLLAHLAFLSVFVTLANSIYAGQSSSNLFIATWAISSLAVAVTAGCTALPPAAWREWFHRSGSLWIYSAVGSGLACWAGSMVRSLWAPITANTFALVKLLLGFVDNQLVVRPEQMRVGTANFTVIISPECSGIEGMGLFLIFSIFWLALFRDELRFPHALAMVPVGVVALYLLNALRIAALVLIGDAGWKDVAVRGFHSQAGWIAFNGVALLLLVGARRIPWLRGVAEPANSVDEFPAAPFLIPFLALLAAGILSGAMTAHFEWLYSLRLLAAAIAFWRFRHRYRSIDWKFGWLAVIAGVAVFAIWIAIDRLMPPATIATGMPPQLANSPTAEQLAWLAARVTSAVIAVPVVEELAFRGFGLRRLIAEDFEAVPWHRYTVVALSVSSIVFGVLHGGLWVAGILAGFIYGLVMVRRGRLGESIGAHATTNALLAVYVMLTGRWDLW